MNHLSPQDQKRLNDLLDGRLSPAAADALRARIDAEPALREVYDDLQRMRDWTRAYGEQTASLEAPAGLADAIRVRTTGAARGSAGASPSGPPSEAASDAGTDGTSQAVRPPAGRLLRLLTVSYAAAALLVVGLTVQWALRDRSEGPSVADPSVTTTARSDADPEVARRRRQGDVPASGSAKDGAWSQKEAARAAEETAEEGLAREALDSRSAPDSAKAEELASLEDRKMRMRSKLKDGRAPAPQEAGDGGSGFGSPGGGVSTGLRAARDAEAPKTGAPKSGAAKSGAAKSGAPNPGTPKPGAPAGDDVSAREPASPQKKGEAARGRATSGGGSGGGGAGEKAAAPSGSPKMALEEAPKRVRKQATTLRAQLAKARLAGERVYVIEADDPESGLAEARKLLDGLSPTFARLTEATADESAPAGADADDVEADADGHYEAKQEGRRWRKRPRASAEAETRTADEDAEEGAGARAVRFYRLTGLAATSAAGNGRARGRPADMPPSELGQIRLPYVGSVGRSLPRASILRLDALAQAGELPPAPSAAPVTVARENGVAGKAKLASKDKSRGDDESSADKKSDDGLAPAPPSAPGGPAVGGTPPAAGRPPSTRAPRRTAAPAAAQAPVPVRIIILQRD